jgi:outer membrane protein, adhesin transport system
MMKTIHLRAALTAGLMLLVGGAWAQSVLDQLLGQAVTTHPSVIAKQFDVEGGQFGVDAAKWQYYPTPSLLTERAANETYKNFGVTTSSTLRLQQPLWSGGRIDANMQSAKIKREAAIISVEEARWSVALHTLDAWQNFQLAQGRAHAGDTLIQQLQNLNAMMERRVTQQISPAIDAQLLQARLAQAKSDQRLAQTAVQAARAKLVQWAGDTATNLLAAHESEIRIQKSKSPSKQHIVTLDAAGIDRAISYSPSLLRYEQETALAKQDVQLKKSEQWPSVYARLDRQFNDYGNFGTKAAISTVYIGLQYTPGAGLATQSEVQALLARQQSIERDRETLRRQIKSDIESEWRDYQASTERILLSSQVKSGSAELFDSYTRLFVAGRRSWLELLNTLREQNAADIQLSDLEAQKEASYYRLRLYLGELPWQNKGVK